ncbi:hypothetical protein BsWGS_17860 [Bradybaena similaris]
MISDTNIGDYEIIKGDLLGTGAFAAVWKGRSKKDHSHLVAIKAIKKNNLIKSQQLLINKEITILKELTSLHHRNVVELLDCVELKDGVCLVMEYCNGGDLADCLHRHGTLSEDTLCSYVKQIAEAMKALQHKGIVHRDLKPQNILLCYQGPKYPHPSEMLLKITDFGLARFISGAELATIRCGSHRYMAPEVIMSVKYNAKADLWSIGTILYQCLTGRAPFQARNLREFKKTYEKNPPVKPNIPVSTSPELRDLLLRMLKRDAEERISFDEFFRHPFLLVLSPRKEDDHSLHATGASFLQGQSEKQGYFKDNEFERVWNTVNKQRVFHGNTENKQVSLDNTSSWQGVSIDTLKRAPECFQKEGVSLPLLKPSSEHIVFLIIPSEKWKYAAACHEYWDDAHVYMPYHENNKMPEAGPACSRHERIVMALTRKIPDTYELENAILSYNPHHRRRWNFDALHWLFEESEKGAQIKDEFFTTILPRMQDLALQLKELCPMGIPILKQGRNMKLTFSQQQIACLLANAFFCTFPKRDFRTKHCKLPDIYFCNLFSDSHASHKVEKLSCIINYFRRVIKDMPKGTVTYARQHIEDEHDFPKMDKKFSDLHVSTTGTIEDDGRGMLQVDFANKYVGGGVLGHGLMQEEILFVICPEMILSRLFTEALTDSEVLIMTGCERFSTYNGHSDTFKYGGDYVDHTEVDEWGRRYTEVVAMDALVFHEYKTQFEKDKILRELKKAYCAFKGSQLTNHLPAVCTGNWGTGAFGGDKQLKAIIQWMAASLVNRDICYFTFGDSKLCAQLGQAYHLFKDNDLQISHVLRFIKLYSDNLKTPGAEYQSLLQFIAKMVGVKWEELEWEPYLAEDTSSQDFSPDFREMSPDDQ